LADGSRTTVGAWVGADTLVACVWRVASTRGLTVHIETAPLVETTARTRRRVAAAASLPVLEPALVQPVELNAVVVPAGYVHSGD
jgi:hypothetical protein